MACTRRMEWKKKEIKFCAQSPISQSGFDAYCHTVSRAFCREFQYGWPQKGNSSRFFFSFSFVICDETGRFSCFLFLSRFGSFSCRCGHTFDDAIKFYYVTNYLFDSENFCSGNLVKMRWEWNATQTAADGRRCTLHSGSIIDRVENNILKLMNSMNEGDSRSTRSTIY